MFYLDSTPYAHEPATLDWVQSCWVDIHDANIVAIGHDDPVAFTGTYLDININASASGACGNGEYDVSLSILKKLDCDLTSCDMADALEQHVTLDNGVITGTDNKLRIHVADDGDACYNTKMHLSAEGRDGARLDVPMSRPVDNF